MCCKERRMGMISSRQWLLSRTSEMGVESNRSWGSKAMRMVGGLEDFRVGNPRSGIPRGEIRALAEIFERNPWRKPWKKQVQPHIPTDTRYAVGPCAGRPRPVATGPKPHDVNNL